MIGSNENVIHQMIKNDAFRYFSHGYEIKEDLKNGKNYFETGRKHFTKYLYPRIIAAYYLFFDIELFDNKELNKINLGVHDIYLFLQSLIYFLAILFLYFQIKGRYSVNIIYFVVGFLCLEPTLFQYHASFWSETIFFSLQIFLLALVVNNTKKKIRYLIIGTILGLIALQRTPGFFYVFIIVIYYYFSIGKEFNKKILLILIPYLLIIFFTGYHNYIRSNKFYFMPSEIKAVTHAYVIKNILSEKEFNKEKDNTLNWIKEKNLKIDYSSLKYKNGFDIDYSKYSFIFCENANNEVENENYIQVCNYLKNRSFKILYNNIFKTGIYVIKQSMHTAVLNPFHIYTDHKFNNSKKYYHSPLKNKLIPYRIIYSLLIFFICLIGLIAICKNKNKDKDMLCLVLLSVAYFF